MKNIALLFALLAVIAVAIAELEDEREEYCKEELLRKPRNGCYGLKCDKNNTGVRVITCPLTSVVEGQKVRVEEEDDSKPFPDCCRRIIYEQI